jgi:hypothetical protein
MGPGRCLFIDMILRTFWKSEELLFFEEAVTFGLFFCLAELLEDDGTGGTL